MGCFTHIRLAFTLRSKPERGQGLLSSYRLRIGQGAEPVVVFLSSCVPQSQVHRLPIHHYIGGVVIEPAGRQEGRSALAETHHFHKRQPIRAQLRFSSEPNPGHFC